MNVSLLSPSKLLALITAATLTVGLAACGEDSSPDESVAAQETIAPPKAEPGKVYDQGLPIGEAPNIEATRGQQVPCPYIDGVWLENANGQKLTAVGIDERFDTPACVFWSYEDTPQVTVTVRHMADDEAATAVVDWAAPIDSTQPADLPGGWMGGRTGNEMGSVYAVQNGNVAIVVRSAQQQSVKAETIAKEALSNLGLL